MRNTGTTTWTTVTVLAEPMGRARENGPHLADLRKFVEECEGLPDDVRVMIEASQMNESGRHNVKIWLHHKHPTEEGEPC